MTVHLPVQRGEILHWARAEARRHEAKWAKAAEENALVIQRTDKQGPGGLLAFWELPGILPAPPCRTTSS